jgi:hypothetical protein
MNNTYNITTLPISGFIRPFGKPTSLMSESGIVTVNEGESVTFSMLPATDGEIKDVVVDGASVGKLGSYTFDNITSDHTIVAYFDY